ncbi:hypothetical protein SCHPADRAFT_941393 [Schizopora paradoxa]|uniref:DUF6534 domain-containing protein n=1 Tax=Schizopora paradoxa TaxID=27342 RepID=A0A0H2S5J4_9AGAM|nr:hypothetical protein SCHPADRAFT_941393 [Schizopora paradoxa]
MPDFRTTSGPLLLGYLFNWGLFGVLSVQVYFYHLAFPGDRRSTKWLVFGIYLLELTQTIMMTHDAFGTYAVHYGEVEFLYNLQMLPITIPILSALVSCAVQMHYGNLLRVLSGSKILGLTVAIFALIQASAALVQAGQTIAIKDRFPLSRKSFVSETVWLAGSAICDLIIASAMTFTLMQKDTGLPATHALITKLVRIIVETGCLTAITTTVTLALFISVPDKAYYPCLTMVLAKLYSNSLLAILNSRIRIEGVHTSAQIVTGSSLAFYERSTTSRRTALPYVDVVTKDDRNIGPHVVDVHILRRTGTRNVMDEMHATPIDDTISKDSTINQDEDSVLSKA